MYLGTAKAKHTVEVALKRLEDLEPPFKGTPLASFGRWLDKMRKTPSNKFLWIFSASILLFIALAVHNKWYKLPDKRALIVAAFVSMGWCVILEHYSIAFGGWNYFHDYTYLWIVPVQNWFLYLFSTALGIMYGLSYNGRYTRGGGDVVHEVVALIWIFTGLSLVTFWAIDVGGLQDKLTYFTLMMCFVCLNFAVASFNKSRYSDYTHLRFARESFRLVMICYGVELLTAWVSYGWIVDGENTILTYIGFDWMLVLNVLLWSMNLAVEEFIFYWLFVNLMGNIYLMGARK